MCEKRRPSGGDDPQNDAASSLPWVPGAGSAVSASHVLHPATRCGECHGPITKEWKASAHARGDVTGTYVAMRSHVDRASCDRCHAPLESVTEYDNLATRDAVGCDVCHTIRDVPSTGKFQMHLGDIVKFGPLCDAKDNYFHKVGCSPLHGTSELCSACHSLSWKTKSGETLTVQSEFEEWRASIYGSGRIECQSCHMPGSHDSVAVGSPARGGVPNHSFSLAELRKSAILMSVTVRDSGSDVEVDVSLKNNKAGHSIPSGLPERRLALRVTVTDELGKVTHRAQQVYGRILADERGPAPFYAADRLQTDTRIQAMETRQEQFKLAGPDKGTAEVTLVFIDIAPEIASALGVEPTEDVIARVGIPLGARGPSGAHARLPKTVEP
jgi:hypothetical protein